MPWKALKEKLPRATSFKELHRRKTQATSRSRPQSPSEHHHSTKKHRSQTTGPTEPNCAWESKWPDLLKHTCLNLTTQYILLILTTSRLKTTILETDKSRRKTHGQPSNSTWSTSRVSVNLFIIHNSCLSHILDETLTGMHNLIQFP